MRKTKIVCTIGPATANVEAISALVDAGMDVARINLSHGTQQEHSSVVKEIRQVAEDRGFPVAILMDLAGPKMRLGDFPKGAVTLHKGDKFRITTRKVQGTAKHASITYKEFARQVKPDETILLADGTVRLLVEATSDTNVDCVVEEGGEISSHKGVNIIGPSLEIPAFTAKDREDLAFAARIGIDYIGLSFCHRPSDVLDAKQALAEMHSFIPIIAKIEKKEAVERIEEIVDAADGVMVARGDLGVEIPIHEVPIAQKRIIACANAANKPVITATQMLCSMVSSTRPTRAETTDVANAILDGTDATMLSEETAVGLYPFDSVKMMSKIANCIEPCLKPKSALCEDERGSIDCAIGHSAATAALDLGASAIVAFTRTGRTANLISRYRLPMPIVAITPNRATFRRLNLLWGVMPILIEDVMSTDHMLEVAERVLSDRGIIHKQEIYIVTAGLPASETTPTNFMRAARL
ncbi:MAG: pyruvate kinase [Candidatus Coatesbacteria bacterium]|nr:pyruvate kinase [Candidatus Coatesbacteria bacterium]